MNDDDQDFVRAIEDKTLPPDQFHHLGHLRLAYLCLIDAPFEQGAARCSNLIRSYAIHQGATEKYHHTLTMAILQLMAFYLPQKPVPFKDWLEKNQPVFRDIPALLAAHYSPERLAQADAKHQFLAPDLAPLPARPSNCR